MRECRPQQRPRPQQTIGLSWVLSRCAGRGVAPGRCNFIQEWVRPRLFAGQGWPPLPGQRAVVFSGRPDKRVWMKLQGERVAIRGTMSTLIDGGGVGAYLQGYQDRP